MGKRAVTARPKLIFTLLLTVLFFGIGCSGCAPTYPKEKLEEALIDVCRKEYALDVQAKLVDKTLVVFIPLDEFYDTKLDVLPKAVEKIGDVIQVTSRLVFSTDAEIDFYMVVAADVKITAVEIVSIQYINDLRKLVNGWIGRDEYRKRVLWERNFDPQYLKDAEFKFEVEPVRLPEFLAKQIAQRINLEFESLLEYKLQVKSAFDREKFQFYFTLLASDDRDFREKFLPVILREVVLVVNAYKFQDFKGVEVANLFTKKSVFIEAGDLEEYVSLNKK